MSTSGLLHDIKKYPRTLAIAIGLHVVVLVLLSISLTSSKVPKMSAPARSTVKAVLVDEKKVEAEIKKIKKTEDKEQKKKLAKQQKIKKEADNARKKLEAEKKKLAMLKKKEAEEKKKVEAEKKRVEQETEKRREQEAVDLKRKMEEEEQSEEEARLKAENDDRLKTLRYQYIKSIEQKVARNWLRPANATAEMSCTVFVNQTTLGDVISVKLQDCTDNQIFQRSIERAVRKASPLPPAPSFEVFDREIRFSFRPGS